MKRKRIYRGDDEDEDEEDDERREEEEEETTDGAPGDRYRGCDETTRAVRERVVASLAEALSMVPTFPSSTHVHHHSIIRRRL